MLFDRLKDPLRQIVAASLAVGSKQFRYATTFDGDNVKFGFQPNAQSLKFSRGVLSELMAEGFVQATTRSEMTVLNTAYAAVDRDFSPPPPAAPPAPVHVTTNIIKIYGDNNGTLTQGVYVDVTGTDAEMLLAAVRAAAGGDAEVLDQAGFIAEELNTGTPKPGKLKAFLAAALAKAQGNATRLNALVNLATFLGFAAWVRHVVGN